jgi:alpha-beta hydrolase superfamily lysophospholipase
MQNEDFIPVLQVDSYTTKLYPKYSQAKELKGSIVIFHGMAEHHKRYQPFADFLNEQGYDVYLYDHRGHGTDKTITELGFVAKKHGFGRLIKDGIEVLKYVKKNMRSEKLILFAHSMGSLVARNVISYYNGLDAVILCGTANPSKATSIFGLMASGLTTKMKNPQNPSPLLTKAMFGSKLYTDICTRTPFDWITRSEPIVDDYLRDPYCGFPCSSAFLRDIVTLSYHASQKKLILKSQKDLPILFISGSKDPVGGYGKDVTKLATLYKQLKFTKVACKLYKDARHELLNELNASDVMNDVIAWLKN